MCIRDRYELLIIPREHDLHLTDSDDATLRGVGVAIRDALKALREVHGDIAYNPVSYTHLRAHETVLDLVCRLLLEKKTKQKKQNKKQKKKKKTN